MRLLLTAFLLGLALSPAGATQIDFTPHVDELISNYIRPSMNAFEQQANHLPDAVSQVCNDPSKANRAAFAETLGAVTSAFGKVSFLRYGPMLDEDRLNRIAFLPDPRGIAQRQINKFLASDEARSITAAALKDKSVALQGLTALELIAFDQDTSVTLGQPSPDADIRCHYSKAIAGNVAAIAADLKTAWDDPTGYSSVLMEHGDGNPVHKSGQEAMETVFNALPVALIILKDQHILPVIGKGKDAAKPSRLPFSRSGNGLTYIAASLSGVQGALKSLQVEGELDDDYRWVPGSIDFELRNAVAFVSKTTPPLRQTFQTSGAFETLSALVLAIDSINTTLTKELSAALQLTAGFNALDGD